MAKKQEKTLIEVSIEQLIKNLRFARMEDAKNVFNYLLNISNTKSGICEVNDLLRYLKRDPIPEWRGWGWKDLFWDILSNKYGAAFRLKGDNTFFVLQLPPVKYLGDIETYLDPEMGIFTEDFIASDVRIHFDYMSDGSISCDVVYHDILRTYELERFSVNKDYLDLCLKVCKKNVYAHFKRLSDDLYRLLSVDVPIKEDKK